MTLEIQNPRAGAALTDAFDLKGRVRVELEEFIVPTVIVADVSASSPPGVQRTVSAYWSKDAVAGQRACFQLSCPGGTLAVIKRLSFFSTAVTAPDAWFIVLPGSTIDGGISAEVAVKAFTDGRLQETGVEPSCVVTFGTRVSNVSAADWAIPLFLPDATTGAAEAVFEPSWGWVIGSGKAGVTSYLEGSFDGVNMPMTGVIEWEEYQVG